MEAEMIRKMIDFYEGSLHDINHFLKVYAYASTIGALEGVEERTARLARMEAIVHDIACPMCREKYGHADGAAQEENSEPLLREFLAEFSLNPDDLERIIYVVCHHHTYTGVDGLDYQILLEADFLVNADEGNATPAQIAAFERNVFRTEAGKKLLSSIYCA